MKLIKSSLFLFLLLMVILTGCKDDNVTYAEELKAENELILDFISRQNIEVVTEMPTTKIWPPKVFYKTPTGLYFRLTNPGDTLTEEVIAGDKIVPRFTQYTLEKKADTISNMNTIDFPRPTIFFYKNLDEVCAGWHEAVGLMKYDNAEATFIVYSKLGFSTYNRPATPVAYEMKIRIQKY